MAVAATKVLALAPGQALADEKRLLLCGALAVALLAGAGLEWAAPQAKARDSAQAPGLGARGRPRLFWPSLALWGGGLGTPLLMAVVVVLIISMVGLDVYRRLHNPITVQEQPT